MVMPAYVANRLLDDLNITQTDLTKYLDEIVHERGALVVEGDLDGSEARLNMVGKPAIITVSRKITNHLRKRFSVAHELGHLEMHRWKVTLCTTEDMMEWSVQTGSENVEREANEFAAALLMPERFFMSFCDEEPSLDYFKEVANRFRVSLTAASIRYCYFTSEPVAIIFSQAGFVKWFRASKEFEEQELFINVRERAPTGSKAARFFERKSISPIAKRVSADTWLRPGNYDPNASILEQAWPIDSQKAVLTLLWIDNDMDNEDD